MSDVRTDDLKSGTFDTWAVIEAKRAEAVKTVQVKVDHKAATRQAIIVALRREGFTFKTRSDWKAKPGKNSDGPDWDYHGVALHHAGNSFSCDANGAAQLRKAEQIDLSNFGHVSYHYAITCDGTICEALDLREKGAHIASGNTGVVGIVMLADLSVRGEAYQEEYASKSLLGKVRGILKWGPDRLDTATDEPPEKQIKALFALVNVLRNFFPITMLGGHREYQRLSTGEGRACPGAYGMILVGMLRREYKLGEPKK
ncbi:N-acetylmuramoyl-L-alanine amidase [Azoarcus sp. Aa7]|nr:N-acetylmuramoyl-L-alanine amidase [Azoarcus sp. Aa7]